MKRNRINEKITYHPLSLLTACQTISAELATDKLINLVLRSLIEQSQAARSCLVLLDQTGWTLVADACLIDGQINIEHYQATELTATNWPRAILDYVGQTSTNIVYADTAKLDQFTDDDYLRLRQPKSFGCFPLLYQTELIGLVYLEDCQIIVEQLEYLLTQAAISFHHAQLFAQLDQENRAMRESEIKYRSLYSNTPVMVHSIDPNGRLLSVSNFWLDSLGYERAEVLGRKSVEFLTPESRQYAEEVILPEYFKTGICKDVPYQLCKKSGEIIDVLLSAISEYDSDGNVTRSLAVLIDVTEKKQAEEALKENQRLLQAVIDNTTAVIYVLDQEDRYLLVNRQWQNLFNKSGKLVAGKSYYDFFTKEIGDNFLRVNREILKASGAIEVEEVVPQDDGVHTYLSIKFPLRDEKGMAYALCGISTDITERKRAEAEREALKAVEAANRAKNIFLANISHELRTPLNAILGYAQILSRDNLINEKQLARLNTIMQSGKHLLTLINDMLDFAKIEAGRLELHPTETALSIFLQGIIDIIRIKAERKNILFSYQLSPDLPNSIWVDDKRLRQILLNLLDNAVKFTDQGEVSLRVELISQPDQRIWQQKDGLDLITLRFEVKDTGIGIPQKQLESIFLPFEQVGNLEYRSGGSGLGLAICRQLARLLSADIEVKSEVSKGSTFSFQISLPLAETPFNSFRIDRAICGYQGERKKIMIIDDIAENRAMLVDLLAGLNFEIFEATNGQEALAQVEVIEPDLIIMDIMMPVLSGLEAIRLIRQSARLKDIPIIAISASTSRQDQLKSMAVGANYFLAKPINLPEMLAQIGFALGLTWIYQPAEKADNLPITANRAQSDQRTLPPPEEIKILYQLAMIGNMRGIKQRADYLVGLNEQYRPFADKISQLAQGFQSKALLALVEEYLDEKDLK